MNPILAQWNTIPAEEAAQQVLPCCGSHAWAETLAAARPIPDPTTLAVLSDQIWRSLPESAWLEAFSSHPRIGECHANATAKSLAWSATEQSKVEDSAKAALAEANHRYEARFGRTFIVCATGKSAQQMVELLNNRLANTPEAELHEAAEQHRQITQLRLKKWLEAL